ncbi:MAG: DUF169 domain-containing protein [Methanobrevibacter sp.]|jgi:uncharacterized protein (DUF169 family)|nr:DUF169 domain-containing protein [Candidatus Methanovirga basalitermitum]
MNEEDDILKDNEFVSNELKSNLRLNTSPIAIKLVFHEDEIPKGIEKIDKKSRHCEMVKKASNGRKFYGTSEDQSCKGGSAALGLNDMPIKVETGEFYYKLGRFKTVGSGKRTMDRIPKINSKIFAILYSPLELADFQPDIIIIIANPKQGMLISQAIVYTLGGRVEANFAGIQSVCADAVAGPYTTKNPNITLACSGSRKFAGFDESELIIGLNGENIGCTVTALNLMKKD